MEQRYKDLVAGIRNSTLPDDEEEKDETHEAKADESRRRGLGGGQFEKLERI